jgi:hypothetical protein
VTDPAEHCVEDGTAEPVFAAVVRTLSVEDGAVVDEDGADVRVVGSRVWDDDVPSSAREFLDVSAEENSCPGETDEDTEENEEGEEDEGTEEGDDGEGDEDEGMGVRTLRSLLKYDSDELLGTDEDEYETDDNEAAGLTASGRPVLIHHRAALRLWKRT